LLDRAVKPGDDTHLEAIILRDVLNSALGIVPQLSVVDKSTSRRFAMNFSRGVLLWLLGVPIPIILLLALFWHH
jgi:hypothetical protein